MNKKQYITPVTKTFVVQMSDIAMVSKEDYSKGSHADSRQNDDRFSEDTNETWEWE